MTESTRRSLFGKATSTQTLKIKITASIQYNDTPLTLKQSHSLPKTQVNKMNIQSPKATTNIHNISKLKKTSNDFNCDKTPLTMLHNIKKTSAQQTPNVSSSKLKSYSKSKPSPSISTNITTSKTKTTGNRVNDYVNKKLNQQLQQQQQSNEVHEDNDIDVNDVSVVDELISNECVVSQKEIELNEFYNKNLSYENALGVVNGEDNVDNVLAKSKEIISNLFQYQNMFYDILKDKIQTKNNMKELLLKYNEKYRSIFKKQNRLNEQTESNLIRNHITTNIHHEESKHINDIIPLKQNELNVYKELFNTSDKDNNNNNVQHGNDDTMKLLLKAFTNLSKSNSLNKFESNDIKSIKHIMNKYNIAQQQRSNEVKQNDTVQLEYVVNGNESGFDMNDVKLNKYLTMYYSKRKVPKIKFVKTSKNNYEYGTQKVVIKIEGENDNEIIRVRSTGGYILIDKFLELNANSEESKTKHSSNKTKQGNTSTNSSAVKSKKNIKKK